MFARLAKLSERYAAWVVAAWIAIAVVVGFTAPSLTKVGVQDETSFLPGSSPSQQADLLLRRLYPNDPTLNSGILVFSRHSPITTGDKAAIGRIVAYLRSSALASEVKTVQSSATDPALAPELRSPDGQAELVIVGFTAAPFSTRINHVVSDVRHHMKALSPPGLDHHLTGVGGLAADQATGLLSSFARTAVITVLLVLIILFLIYRSAVAALIPLATIGVAFVVASGVVALMAQHGFKVASLAGTFMIVMIFGAGTDYCLFIVSRYREDLGRGEAPAATLRRTMTVMGAVITASGATVIVGFMSQLTARFGLFKTMGPAMGVAVFVTLIAGLTLTPALLRLTGRWAFWPAPLKAEPVPAGPNPTRWERLAGGVRAHPAELLLAAVIVLELPAAGLGWFHQSFDLVRDLPAGADARQGFDTLAAHFPPGTLAPVYVVLDTNGPIVDNARLAAIDRVTEALRRVPGVGQVRSVTQPAGAPLTPATFGSFSGGKNDMSALGLDPDKVDVTPLFNDLASTGGLRFTGPVLHQYPQLLHGPLSFFQGADGRSTRLVVELAGNPYDRHALPVIANLDRDVNAALAGTALSGAHLAVGGPAAFFVDMQSIGNSDFRIMSAALIAGIFIVLALLLRSLIAPFYLLASVVLSYAATMGLTTAVFVGIGGQPGISFWLPPFLFIILVALGADYNIFIMSRIREEAAAGAEIHDAVTRGLVATGRVITSAGLILAGTFAALIFAPLPELREIGFGVTVGVLIDTFVVRSLLVPSATMLLGRWAFWPGMTAGADPQPVRRRHLGLAGAGIAVLAASLVALVATSGGVAPITRISTAAAAPAYSHSQDTGSTIATSPSPQATGQVPSGSVAAAAHSTTTSPLGRPAARGGAQPNATTGSTTPPAAGPSTSAAPTRIAVPATGAWRYHIDGTRKVGAAGSTQPYSEDDTTQVTHTGGDAQSPVMRLVTQTSTGSEDDQRRYAPDGVSLVTTQLSSTGVSYGGTLQPPQLLIPWPIHVGQTWAGDWSTGSVNGHTNGKVTGTRQVTAAGATYNCWVIQLASTFSGSAQGQQQETSCWVPQLGMSVDDNQHYQGTYNGVSFDITSHATLLGAP